jgi:GNAT superfamily N-acetyltransferase
MSVPFTVFSLPRSRSFWLSRYLNYGGWTCGHDQARYIRSLDDVRAWLSLDFTGTVETAAAPFWRLLPEYRPDARMIVIRRPVEEVVESLVRTGIEFDRAILTAKMKRLDRKLDQIEKHGALSVEFDDLNVESVRAKLFEHCLGLPFDPVWDAKFAPINLQIDLASMLRYMRSNAPQLRSVESLCARRIKSILRPPRMGEPDESGITIQQEPFSSAWEGAKAIMAEHCQIVGEAPDYWKELNVPLMGKLDELGAMIVVTARCNGRMLGYLGSVLSASLAEVGAIQATQLGLFVTQDGIGHGLGSRLTKASIEAAFARGCKQVFLRSGVRGDGPRVQSIFRRLGAKEHGQMFMIEREAA